MIDHEIHHMQMRRSGASHIVRCSRGIEATPHARAQAKRRQTDGKGKTD